MKPATPLIMIATTTAAIAQMKMKTNLKSAKIGARTIRLSLLLASSAKANPK